MRPWLLRAAVFPRCEEARYSPERRRTRRSSSGSGGWISARPIWCAACGSPMRAVGGSGFMPWRHAGAGLGQGSFADNNLDFPGAPPRISSRSTVPPTLSAPEMHDFAHAIDRFAFQVMTMSPTSSPARAAGPSGSMLTTRTPRTLLKASRQDGVRAAKAEAGTKISSKNMALRQELIDDAVDCRRGMASARRRGPRTAIRPAPMYIDEGAAFGGRAEHQIQRMRLSMVPPRILCQGPPAMATMPRLATGAPA